MSKEAKQCEVEVARIIAVRTQNVLGTLDCAGGHFSEQAGLEANLLELIKSVLENVQGLVGRCGPSKMPKKRIRDAMFKQSNPNKQALIDAERKLEAITKVRENSMEIDVDTQAMNFDGNNRYTPVCTAAVEPIVCTLCPFLG